MSERLALAPRRADAALLTRPVALAAVVLLALGLRLYHLGALSLWTDEFFTLAYPHLGLAHLWGAGLRSEPTSPAYYMLIGWLEGAFGTGPVALRLPSVLASVATVALAWRLAMVLFEDWRPACLGALLLALAPVSLLFAQQGRAYALQGAALAVAMLGLAHFLRGRRGGLALYAAGGTAAMYLHPTSLLALAALNGAALSAGLGRGRLVGGRRLLAWLGAGVVIAVLSAPLLPVFASGEAAQAVAWIPALTRWSIEGTAGDLLLGPLAGTRDALVAEIGLPVLAVLLLVPPWRPGRAAATVLLVAPALFVALVLGASVVRPMLLTRTVAWLLVPLCVVLGDVLRRRGVVVAGAGLVLAAAAAGLHLARDASQLEDWRGLLARIDPAGAPLIVLAPHSPPAALAAYAPGLPGPVRLSDGAAVTPEVLVSERVFGTKTLAAEGLAEAIAAHRRVWLIYRRPDEPWVMRLVAGLPAPGRRLQDAPGPNPALGALAWN